MALHPPPPIFRLKVRRGMAGLPAHRIGASKGPYAVTEGFTSRERGSLLFSRHPARRGSPFSRTGDDAQVPADGVQLADGAPQKDEFVVRQKGKRAEEQEMRQNASRCSTQWQIFPLVEPESLSELPKPPLRACRLKAFADGNVTDKQQAELAGL